MHKVGKLEAYPTLVSASISAGSSGLRLNQSMARNAYFPFPKNSLMES